MRNPLVTTLVALSFGLCGPALAQNATPPSAAEPDAGPTTVIRGGDGALTCVQLGEEAARLSETMGGSPSGGVIGAVGGVARSGAAALIPGAGLVMAGVDALAKPGRERREAETLAVEHRWYYLNGLYAGRGCGDQAQATPTPPRTAPVPQVGPVVPAPATAGPVAAVPTPRPAPTAPPAAAALSAAPATKDD